MIIDALIIGLIITSIIISITGMALGSFALIKVIAMEKSTHTVAWKDPFESEEAALPTDEELNQKLNTELDHQMRRPEEPSFQYEKDVIA